MLVMQCSELSMVLQGLIFSHSIAMECNLYSISYISTCKSFSHFCSRLSSRVPRLLVVSKSRLKFLKLCGCLDWLINMDHFFCVTVVSYIYVFCSGLLSDALFVYFINDTTFPSNYFSRCSELSSASSDLIINAQEKPLFNLFQNIGWLKWNFFLHSPSTEEYTSLQGMLMQDAIWERLECNGWTWTTRWMGWKKFWF